MGCGFHHQRAAYETCDQKAVMGICVEEDDESGERKGVGRV